MTRDGAFSVSMFMTHKYMMLSHKGEGEKNKAGTFTEPGSRLRTWKATDWLQVSHLALRFLASRGNTRLLG